MFSQSELALLESLLDDLPVTRRKSEEVEALIQKVSTLHLRFKDMELNVLPSALRVLVIDDDPLILATIELLLLDMGFCDIVKAESGLDAATKMRESKQAFDLVICDWHMPEMTGFELLRVMRRIPALKHVPFVILTSDNKRQHIEQAVEQGVSAYIVKPIVEDIFSQKIMDVLSKGISD